MKIVVAGGNGFLGRPLSERLASDRHEVVVLTRHPEPRAATFRQAMWWPDGRAGEWASEVDGATAIVNLAGESIAARRWSAAQKQAIFDSRVTATRSLVAAIASASRPPVVLGSGSAVGYYGPCDAEPITESAPPGSDFLARVCVEWEAEAMRGAGARTRVALVRTGLVLDRSGGALPQMLPPFKLGVGGPVGSGQQYWPWIHLDDWIELVRWIVLTAAAAGPLNATAPEPVTNRAFAKALGRVLRRPSFIPAPAFALRALLGEMADGLLLAGQRAVPARAEALGFRFRFPRLEPALADIFR
jgi:uncharacterized protein